MHRRDFNRLAFAGSLAMLKAAGAPVDKFAGSKETLKGLA